MDFYNIFDWFPRNFRFNYDKSGNIILGKENEEEDKTIL